LALRIQTSRKIRWEGGLFVTDRNPGRALDVVRRIEVMCDFVESEGVREAVNKYVPVTMPFDPGSLGFDIPLWVGLGIVGLWAALDAFGERGGLPDQQCSRCGKSCIAGRFGGQRSLQELEDLRHLYAHNYAGDADDQYFDLRWRRHVLARGVVVPLLSGGRFDGERVHLDLPQLRFYARAARDVLQRFV